ncbi:MAG: TAXI family TRAP transporter solute-binding subunit [Deltaproteobacteria bacterium]|nr:TAXI family TRAP transporter solute-binding subunit [Deltaproteobacteria bacterium]
MMKENKVAKTGFDGLFRENWELKRRDFLKLGLVAGGALALGNPGDLFAQANKRISIATGGMGGVYFVIGGGIASLATKYGGVEAAAEVTAASVDNCKLLAAKKSDFGLIMSDTGYDAFKGTGHFKGKPLPVRTVTVMYPNLMHVVTLEGKGITKVSDLKGKRISTGAPGSGTEVKALRVLEAAGINVDKDVKRDRLGAGESGGAMKDGKIDAYFWDGGVPTSSVLDLAASPGIKMILIQHDELISKMVDKYGPVYYKSVIPKKVYTGVEQDTQVAAVANLLMCHQDLDEKTVYNVLVSIFDHLKELAAIHKEALNITLKDGSANTAVPYHKGAQKFFKERKFEVPA